MSERSHWVYDQVPWHVKESASLPDRYHDLTNDQKYFLDEFYLCSLAESSLRDDLSAIAADLEEVIERIKD